MSDVLSLLLEGLGHAAMMGWEIWWALVLGFAISAMVQAWAPHERIEALLSGPGAAPIARATGFGAASSSCSYAAIAIGKSLAASSAGLVPTRVISPFESEGSRALPSRLSGSIVIQWNDGPGTRESLPRVSIFHTPAPVSMK